MKLCPSCQLEIQDAAIKCRWCHKYINGHQQESAIEPNQQKRKPWTRQECLVKIGVAITFLLIFVIQSDKSHRIFTVNEYNEMIRGAPQWWIHFRLGKPDETDCNLPERSNYCVENYYINIYDPAILKIDRMYVSIPFNQRRYVTDWHD